MTLMGYDLAGNLAWSAAGLAAGTSCNDGGPLTLQAKSTRTYDNRNRLVELEFGDDQGEQVWTYTDDSLPATVWTYNAKVRSEVVQNAYVYNKRRLLTGESVHQPGYTWSLGYAYDANGFLNVQTYPDTSSTTYTVDARGRTTAITGTSGTYASGASYHPNGALKQFTYGNGIVHTLTQNARGLPDRSLDVYTGSTAVLDDSYDYDFNGNVAAISDGRPGGVGNRTMTYDGLDRLKSVNSPMYNGTISYTYDVLDNIQTLVAPANPARNRVARDLRYCYQSNRLDFIRSQTPNCTSGSATTALKFDTQGNVDTKNAWDFDFSQDNRLRVAKESGVVKEQYRYDAHGRRVNSESPTLAAIRSFYNQGGQLAFQQDLRQGKNLAHVYLAGSLVTTREQPTAGGAALLKFHHTDALGSPIAVTGIARNEIELRSEYEPYGEVINRPLNDRPGYTGHVEDKQTGLTYMQQRYFDPVCGCFLSVDPVTAYSNGDIRFFARYAYGFNNPYKFTDLDGREAGDPFKTRREAAKDVIDSINPTSKKENLEYGGKLYKLNGSYYATNPVQGSEDGVNPNDSPIPEGAEDVGDYHTHAEYSQVDANGNIVATGDPGRDDFDSDNFSGTDKKGIAADAAVKSAGAGTGQDDYRGYLGTPSGATKEYEPINDKVEEVQ